MLDLLRSEAARVRRSQQFESRRAKLEAIGKHYANRLSGLPATPEEIIGYDENGLPK